MNTTSSEAPVRRGLPATHPGEILREDVFPALNEAGHSMTAIANALGVSRQLIYSIMREEQGVTADMAMRLGKLCGNGPNVWLALQARWDIERLTESMADELEEIPELKAAC